MSCDEKQERECLGCGVDLSWRHTGVTVDSGVVPAGSDVFLAPVSYVIATLDGVPIRGLIDRDHPAYGLMVARSPFCQTCYDTQMARAVEMPPAEGARP